MCGFLRRRRRAIPSRAHSYPTGAAGDCQHLLNLDSIADSEPDNG